MDRAFSSIKLFGQYSAGHLWSGCRQHWFFGQPFQLTMMVTCCLWLLVANDCVYSQSIRATTCQRGILFHRGEDFEVRCDIYRPQRSGPFPAIVAIHGGAWKFGNKLAMLRHARLMAKNGYVVMSINYRLAPQHPYPAQILDAKRAVAWLRTNADDYDVDADRIGAYGYSAGGHLAAMLGCTSADDGFENFSQSDLANQPVSTRVSAVVIGGAPCEFSWIKPRSTAIADWIGGTRAEIPLVYRRASPTGYASADDPPFYIYHGEKDLIVPLKTSQRMLQALKQAGVSAELDVSAGSTHFWTYSELDYMKRGIRFFNQHLKTPAERALQPIRITNRRRRYEPLDYRFWLARQSARSLLDIALRLRYQ